MSTGHILISHNFKIHINTMVQSTHISSKWCLRYGYFWQPFLWLILICYACHFFSPSCPRHNQRCVQTPSSLPVGFLNFSKKNYGYMSTGRIVFDICPFQSQTLTVCRNVCNHLTSNVASYNRRKFILFMLLWKPTIWRICMDFSLNVLAYKLLQFQQTVPLYL